MINMFLTIELYLTVLFGSTNEHLRRLQLDVYIVM